MAKGKRKVAPQPKTQAASAPRSYRQVHLSFGWWALLCYLTLGIALEALHGLKIGWYLQPAYEVRRLTFTLGHAHGVLLALVNIVFGLTAGRLAEEESTLSRVASPCLLGATILLPFGFVLGGIFIHAGDPGLGILLVPLGAVLLFIGVFLTASAVSRRG